MQEIGTWTTAEGTVEATLQLESEVADDDSAQELPKWASGALSGAAGGAATGAVAGPWGALIGAAAGAALGGAAAAAEPPPPKTPPPPKAAPRPAGKATAPVGGDSRASAIRALQQFAAAVPALIQLVAASGAPGGGAKRSEFGDSDGAGEFAPTDESLEGEYWARASEYEGAWTTS
jgi:hypothetical protein